MYDDDDSPRDITLIREEIDALTGLLNNLPEDYKYCAGFLSYRQRIAELKQELLDSWCLSFEKLNDRIQASPERRTNECVKEVAELCAVLKNSVPHLMAH
ncbi:MAG: hypothetical protein WCT04_01275 [Planctomycetota bacterium]